MTELIVLIKILHFKFLLFTQCVLYFLLYMNGKKKYITLESNFRTCYYDRFTRFSNSEITVLAVGLEGYFLLSIITYVNENKCNEKTWIT